MSQKSRENKNKRLDDIFNEVGLPKLSHDDVLKIATEHQSIRKRAQRKDNACGKVCFTSESASQKAVAFRLNKSSNVSSLRSYFCDTCAAWHMTSTFYKKTKL